MTNKNAPPDQHVIVIGAGYAVRMCALQLAPHALVALVDPAGHLTERVRSHELAIPHPGAARHVRGMS